MLLRSLYYLFPRFIRHQYIDSIIFYRHVFFRLISLFKSKENKPEENRFDVRLVGDLELLGGGCEIIQHVSERYASVQGPLLYVDNQECKRSSLEGRLPDTKVVRLSGVQVIGSTDAVISGINMYHHELSLMENIHDLKRPDIFLKYEELEGFDFQISFIREKLTLDGLVVSLLKEHSTNYYHWVTEVIPKLANMMEYIESKDEKITILVEEGTPQQSLSLIELLLSELKNTEYHLCHVKKGQLVYCESLIYCTPLWTSLDNTRSLPNPKKEFFVSSDCLKKVKDKLSKNTLSNNYILKNKKIYLQRENTKLRKLSNVLDLERLLYRKGFDFVDPGSLDFFEQYNLFSQAEVIVGASGAAFTNLLFMKPGSTAISLYPSAQSTNYYVFQPLADVSNVHLIHFLTTPDDNSNSVHGDANVDVKELEKLLEKLDD
ncbi:MULTISPECIES: DUF563 domain-containing protein [Vibrio]|uniref:Capsular biosynthesis protein n=4 Tax=Vibrio TaxID=662 RepID=A0A2N7NMA6_9VIBR|nr:MULTISPECIES: glycosyltransferase family 61 protein [Vibrio]EAQ53104.1 Capsular polysaccharide biosynthesis protein-like [Vibrio sp. MED222]PMP16975.1 capsular biosynthesis protein [Vibrio tasmaniensis]TKG28696.1 glycosyltransferase family 61 protein [Vibrio tasmaniensis]TKG39492.1 glycosyltransferase family 61 protein [Vibrio tasmaniensis]TKG43400.1 glycosyltransferase family 61 protein [Vibrio tasmaniensis]